MDSTGDEEESEEVRHEAALRALGEFRSSLACDLDRFTSLGSSRANRAAAQEGLQLVWSFVASGVPSEAELGSGDQRLLRAAFPDELFGSDPDARFAELLDSVTIAYADRWRYSASEHLCGLLRGCVSAGDSAPVSRYSDTATALASYTCAAGKPLSARSAAALARYDAMLRRLEIFAEVAIDEVNVPETEQIKAFSSHVTPDHATSFRFLGRLDSGLSMRLLRPFTEQFGHETTAGLLEQAIENEGESETAATRHLRQLLKSLEELG